MPPAEPVAMGTGDVNQVVPSRTEISVWMEDRQLSFYVLLILTGVATYLTYIIFRPFLTALFLALVMAIALFPLHKWLARRFRNGIAALTTTGLAVVVILIPLVFISLKLVSEATSVYSNVLQPLGNPSTWPQRLDPVIQQVAEQTGMPAGQLKADIMARARDLGTWSLGMATSFGRKFVQQMGTLGLAAIFLFPFLRYGDEFRRGAISLLPLPPSRARELAFAINQGVIADIYGMVAVAIIEGSLIGLGFWITGVRSALLWGATATVLSCLPFIGVSLIWIPACIFLALRGMLTSAAVLLIWCLIVVATTEGVVRSTVVSGRARLNSTLITLSIMGGVVAFGAVGIFAGPVVLVLVATLIRILREEHATTHESRAPA